MLTHIGYQQVSVPQCHPRLQCRVSPLGTAAQGILGMQDDPWAPGKQKIAHLGLQLRGFPPAAQGHRSLPLQHALQGGTHRPAGSHQQHRLPTCVTPGKSFSRSRLQRH